MSQANRMKPIIGSVVAVESGEDRTRAPTDAEGFLFVARHMLDGAQVLAAASEVPVIALSHLCGHAAESALKAMLSQVGISASKLGKPPLGHGLSNLWARAVAEGVPLSNPPDAWLEQLNRIHAAPYPLRYPLGLHGVALPNAVAMLRGVEELVTKAAGRVQ